MNWKATTDELVLVRNIAIRAIQQNFVFISMTDLVMDIIACHCNGCSLKLEELLNADDVNFAHDVSGITNNLNRQTGQLENHFVPRYAQ